MNELTTKNTDVANEVTEEEIDTYLETKKTHERLLKSIGKDTPSHDLVKRIKSGEKINHKELAKIRKELEREKAKAELTLAKNRPMIDAIEGQMELANMLEFYNCDKLTAYLTSEFKPNNGVEKTLLQQMAITHKAAIKILGNLHVKKDEPVPMAFVEKHVNISVKLMDAYQKSCLALHKIRSGGQQTVVVKHQHVQVGEGAQAVVANEITHRGAGGNNEK